MMKKEPLSLIETIQKSVEELLKSILRGIPVRELSTISLEEFRELINRLGLCENLNSFLSEDIKLDDIKEFNENVLWDLRYRLKALSGGISVNRWKMDNVKKLLFLSIKKIEKVLRMV